MHLINNSDKIVVLSLLLLLLGLVTIKNVSS